MIRGRQVPLFIALLLMCIAACAEEASDPLADANALYRDGSFAEAAGAYRDAMERGWDGPRVHYNLANALYRSGETGEAIAHYQAARVMAPRDPDIRANLDRALSERPAGRPAPPASWLHAVAAKIVGYFTLSEFATAGAVCWWGALAALVLRFLAVANRRTANRVAIVLGVLLVIIAAFGVGRWWSRHAMESAVVSAETTQLRTGPGESFEVAMSVQEGWLLRVIRREAGWANVNAEGGANGWLPTSDLAFVRPVAERAAAPEG